MLGATLLLASGAAAAWSTYLHWLPCRGRMLSGSILRGYQYDPDFSDACLRRMDGGTPFPFPPEPSETTPWAIELGVAAMVLAGLAWVMIVLGARWSLKTTAVALLPSLATFIVATQTESSFSWLLWMSIDFLAVAALIAIMASRATTDEIALFRLVLALWGTTAFGMFQGIISYGFMINFSDANWDVPPGTGYLTAAVLVLAAVFMMIMTLVSEQQPTPVSAPPGQLTSPELTLPEGLTSVP